MNKKGDINRKEQSNVKEAVPFFAVSNMEVSLQFYMQGLGFEMRNKWIDEGKLRWCWLQLGGAAIMLQEYRKEGHDSWLPSCKLGEGVSINFICEDAVAIYKDLIAKELPASRPFVGNNMWVTEIADPDGYRLLFESNTEVPEETVFLE